MPDGKTKGFGNLFLIDAQAHQALVAYEADGTRMTLAVISKHV
jgi:hypothetical protein